MSSEANLHTSMKLDISRSESMESSYPTLTTEQMGQFWSNFEKVFCKLIADGVELQNQRNVPPSLRATPQTVVRIEPDRIVPAVYFTDRNKDKIEKKLLNKSPMPRPISYDPTGLMSLHKRSSWISQRNYMIKEKSRRTKQRQYGKGIYGNASRKHLHQDWTLRKSPMLLYLEP